MCEVLWQSAHDMRCWIRCIFRRKRAVNWQRKLKPTRMKLRILNSSRSLNRKKRTFNAVQWIYFNLIVAHKSHKTHQLCDESLKGERKWNWIYKQFHYFFLERPHISEARTIMLLHFVSKWNEWVVVRCQDDNKLVDLPTTTNEYGLWSEIEAYSKRGDGWPDPCWPTGDTNFHV